MGVVGRDETHPDPMVSTGKDRTDTDRLLTPLLLTDDRTRLINLIITIANNLIFLPVTVIVNLDVG